MSTPLVATYMQARTRLSTLQMAMIAGLFGNVLVGAVLLLHLGLALLARLRAQRGLLLLERLTRRVQPLLHGVQRRAQAAQLALERLVHLGHGGRLGQH